jgi:hypothetical protein
VGFRGEKKNSCLRHDTAFGVILVFNEILNSKLQNFFFKIIFTAIHTSPSIS